MGAGVESGGTKMTDQIMVMGNAVIGELEIYGMNLKDENEKLKKTIEKLKAENNKLESLWRDHLDETHPDDDDDAEKEARQIFWDDGDTEKLHADEDCDKESITASWYELNVGI